MERQPGSTGSRAREAQRSRPGGAQRSHQGGDQRSRSREAKRSRPGGAQRSHQGGDQRSRPGGDQRSRSREAKRSRPGGDQRSRSREAKRSRPGGAQRSQSREAKRSMPSEATGQLQARPGEAQRSRPAACSPMRVKKENDGDSTDGHSHSFTVKFSSKDHKEYTITCEQPGTVLEAIKSSKRYQELKFEDENILIQLSKNDKEYIVATHFPCSCISEGESLFIKYESEKVEAAQDQDYKTLHSKDMYSVFYIDKDGGQNTKTKKLFISSAVKQFKYLCVYGEKGMTVEEALQRDGRFIDHLSNFTLSDNDNPNCLTECNQSVDNLAGKKFKLCLPKDTNPGASDISHQRRERNTNTEQNRLVSTSKTAVLDVLQQKGTSVSKALANKDKNVNIDEIYEKLRRQFPGLKELMEKRFPDDSYQKALDLRKEDFGKIQQSFSEVHRVRKLIKRGESVCKVVVTKGLQGTGFVLFDNFILTNAHILEGCVEGENLKEGIQVYALFNYEDPEPNTKYYYFLVNRLINYSEGELDYAILELNPEGQISHPTQTKQIKVPPGLLKKFSPMPSNGEACIIGHPAEGLKKMDPTCIIEKEQRENAVHDHLHPHRDTLFILCSINHLIKEQGIENIMMGGNKADKVATYNSFMYHGSSGAPVFDASCKVFGLHTSGFAYGFPKHTESVIESAQPLLSIFQHFVSKLKGSGNEDLLERVKKAAKGNSDLKKVLNAPSTDYPMDTDDPTETDDPMDTTT